MFNFKKKRIFLFSILIFILVLLTNYVSATGSCKPVREFVGEVLTLGDYCGCGFPSIFLRGCDKLEADCCSAGHENEIEEVETEEVSDCESGNISLRQMVGTSGRAICAIGVDGESWMCNSLVCEDSNNYWRCLAPAAIGGFDCDFEFDNSFSGNSNNITIECCPKEISEASILGEGCVKDLLNEEKEIKEIIDDCHEACVAVGDRTGNNEDIERCENGIKDTLVSLDLDGFIESVIIDCVLSNIDNANEACDDICIDLFSEDEEKIVLCTSKIQDILESPEAEGVNCYQIHINEDGVVNSCLIFCEEQFVNDIQRDKCKDAVEFAAYGERVEISEGIDRGVAGQISNECTGYAKEHNVAIEPCFGCCVGNVPRNASGGIIPNCCIQDFSRGESGCRVRPQETITTDSLGEVKIEFITYETDNDKRFKVWYDIVIDQETDIARGFEAEATRIGGTNIFRFFDKDGVPHTITASPEFSCPLIWDSIDVSSLGVTDSAELINLGGGDFALSCWPNGVVAIVIKDIEAERIRPEDVVVMCSPINTRIG